MSAFDIFLYIFAFIGILHVALWWAEWAVMKLEQWADSRSRGKKP